MGDDANSDRAGENAVNHSTASSESTPTLGHLLDRDAEVWVTGQHLPHWAQTGTITFVTIRLGDSIPAEVVVRWNRERIEFMRRHGIECDGNWKVGRDQLDAITRRAFDKYFERAREDTLDSCIGNCELQDPRAAEIVASSLLHFDGERYVMGDFVIMPNHVHCLVAFRQADRMRKQCGEWMRFTARRINQILGRSGELWYEEPFDHLVRSEVQLDYLRQYIADNPIKAKLKAGQYLYRKSNWHF